MESHYYLVFDLTKFCSDLQCLRTYVFKVFFNCPSIQFIKELIIQVFLMFMSTKPIIFFNQTFVVLINSSVNLVQFLRIFSLFSLHLISLSFDIKTNKQIKPVSQKRQLEIIFFVKPCVCFAVIVVFVIKFKNKSILLPLDFFVFSPSIILSFLNVEFII